jgi:hypothetical protein
MYLPTRVIQGRTGNEVGVLEEGIVAKKGAAEEYVYNEKRVS